MAAPGHFSDGFMTNVFPAVTARGNIHKGIIAGKLNGHIPERKMRLRGGAREYSKKTTADGQTPAARSCRAIVYLLDSYFFIATDL